MGGEGKVPPNADISYGHRPSSACDMPCARSVPGLRSLWRGGRHDHRSESLAGQFPRPQEVTGGSASRRATHPALGSTVPGATVAVDAGFNTQVEASANTFKTGVAPPGLRETEAHSGNVAGGNVANMTWLRNLENHGLRSTQRSTWARRRLSRRGQASRTSSSSGPGGHRLPRAWVSGASNRPQASSESEGYAGEGISRNDGLVAQC